MFLLTPLQHIVFVSFERYRSPLTINLKRLPDHLRTLTTGAAAQLADSRLTLVAAAYRATTTISANLIECAADGQGDERLSSVADGIASGPVSLDECVDCVLDWGSSSGIDALVGIAIAV